MKRSKKMLKYAIWIISFIIFAFAFVFIGNKIYMKACSLYYSVANKVDAIENRLNGMGEAINRMNAHVKSLEEPYSFDYTWAQENSPLIAHAMGAVDGYTYTNSLEAFQHNYALGHRIFEIDFDLTDAEYFLIASHDQESWREDANASAEIPYSLENFKERPVHGMYTALDYQDIVQLMDQYSDIYVITDTKYTDYTSVHLAFSQLVKYANHVNASVLDRMIPQIYHEDMLSWIMDIHPFKSVIYTLYQVEYMTDWTPVSIYRFCAESGVRLITMYYQSVDTEILTLWDQLGIIVAAHTCNDINQIKDLFSGGVDMVYTDFVSPGDL